MVSARVGGAQTNFFPYRVLMEKAKEYHHPVYICFVDLRKAYDSVCVCVCVCVWCVWCVYVLCVCVCVV